MQRIKSFIRVFLFIILLAPVFVSAAKRSELPQFSTSTQPTPTQNIHATSTDKIKNDRRKLSIKNKTEIFTILKDHSVKSIQGRIDQLTKRQNSPNKNSKKGLLKINSSMTSTPVDFTKQISDLNALKDKISVAKDDKALRDVMREFRDMGKKPNNIKTISKNAPPKK